MNRASTTRFHDAVVRLDADADTVQACHAGHARFDNEAFALQGRRHLPPVICNVVRAGSMRRQALPQTRGIALHPACRDSACMDQFHDPKPLPSPLPLPLLLLMDSTLALDWHELKLLLEDLHAKLEYTKLMLKLSQRN